MSTAVLISANGEEVKPGRFWTPARIAYNAASFIKNPNGQLLTFVHEQGRPAWTCRVRGRLRVTVGEGRPSRGRGAIGVRPS
jgi:hypothetical protein